MVAVELSDVSVVRSGTRVLDGISFAVERGTVVAVVGPNGAGKSTLLAAISGRLRPATGQVRVHGTVADVLQSTLVDPQVRLPVADVVAMGRYPRLGMLRRFRAADHEAVQQALEAMDLVALRRRTIDALSGGQRQRALVAQGLAQDADVVLLDEPTSALDGPSRRRVLDAVRHEAARSKAVFLATHAFDDVVVADLVLVLAGRMVAFAPPDRALESTAVRQLFGDRPLRHEPVTSPLLSS